MRHSIVLDGQVRPKSRNGIWKYKAYSCKTVTREDGSVLVAAKKAR